MSANKRILIFSTAYLPFIGGAEIAVKEITDRLDATGDYDFEMITINLDGKQKPEEKVGAITVHRLGGSGFFYKLLYPLATLYLARRLHRHQPFDATWSIMASYSGFAALFFKFFYPKVPFVLTLQEGDSLGHIKRRAIFVWFLFKGIFRQADRIQAISSFLVDFARSMGAEAPIEIIPNGVDLQNFSAPVSESEKQKIRAHLPDSTTVLITVSRLVEKNGVGDIIAALKMLPQSTGLLILGTGPLQKSLKEKSTALGLNNRIFFAGLINHAELPKWLAASDIFIRPSLSEGLGSAFIEAMAAGVPIIGTPVGGIPDFLHDSETGLFCQSCNPQSIADVVNRLMTDKTLQAHLKEQGKKLALKYDWKDVAIRMNKEVFNSLKRKH